MNRIFLALVLSFLALQVVAQSGGSSSKITEHSQAKLDKSLGHLIIQTIPSSVMVEIPKLRINGRKLQDSLILEEIFSGEYDLVFRLNRKKIKCKVDVIENKTIHLLVDVKNKTYDVKEIAYKPHLPDPIPVDTNEVYVIVDEMPEFPGGDLELQKWIARHIKYPIDALTSGVTGRVYVGFVVNTEGKIEDVKIIKSVSPSLDAEAKRVLGSMPQWKAGKHQGEFVNVSYTVPMNFQIGR